MNFIFLGQSYYAKIYDTTDTLNASSDSNILIANLTFNRFEIMSFVRKIQKDRRKSK